VSKIAQYICKGREERTEQGLRWNFGKYKHFQHRLRKWKSGGRLKNKKRVML
jgi:hypothetical protein